MGTVYKAHHEVLDRSVALKVPKNELTRDTVFVERFMREAKALGTLKHPHVVSVYDAGVEHGMPFIAMEYVEGRTLADLIRDGGVLSLEDIVRWAWQMADALAYVHNRGILHRDLKSANVIVNGAGAAIITDFGIARLEETSTTPITRGMIGTPAYMSPEQARGQPVDARSDLYSLGIILYECLTGQLPFADENALALIQRVINESPPSLLSRRPDTPAWLRTVVYRCLDKKPARRPKNGRELADEIRPHVSTPSGVAHPNGRAIVPWHAPDDTLISPPHREAARHLTLAVANLARAIQLGGGRLRTTLNDGLTRTWHAALPSSPAIGTETDASISRPPLSPLYRSTALVLVVSFCFTVLWAAIISPLLRAESEVESWGAYVTPVPVPDRPEAAHTPLPYQELSVSETTEPRVRRRDSTRAASRPAIDTAPATPQSDRIVGPSRPVQVIPIEPAPLTPDIAGPKEPVGPTRFTVLPAPVWVLTEQESARDFTRQLRALVKDRQVAVIDSNQIDDPEAAYVFLVDEASDRVLHVLTREGDRWIDLKTNTEFVATTEGFRPAAEPEYGTQHLAVFWVEPAAGGTFRNKKRVGW
jgi:serine/threonine protein kinase